MVTDVSAQPIGPIFQGQGSVSKHQLKLHNIPEELVSNLHCGGRLKSSKLSVHWTSGNDELRWSGGTNNSKIKFISFNLIIINCNWAVTRRQWLFYMYTKHEIRYC